MRDVLKFLLVLSAVHLVSSAVTYRKGLAAAPKKVTCPDGQYNYKELGFCFKCTQCAEFLYVKEKCSEFSNTVCGWCGKEPNYSEISDEVLASYQNKCLMSRLDFVNMSQLEKELLEEEEANFDSGSMEDDEPNFGWGAEENVSDEMEGMLPRYDDSEEQASSESEDTSETEEDERDAKGEEKKDDYEEEEEGEEGGIDKSISEQVQVYLLEKGERNEDSKEKFIKNGVTILSRDEVEASLKHLVELVPVQRIIDPEEMIDSSSEDSNERDIKWDRWVDDEVKPIREYVFRDDSDPVDAEELSMDEPDSIRVFSLHVSRQDLIKPGEEAIPTFSDRLRAMDLLRCLMRITIFFIGMAIIIFVFSKVLMRARAMRAERRHFQGVPTDCQDYHMIIDASRYVEEMEKKEQKAAKHIHENPAFDI